MRMLRPPMMRQGLVMGLGMARAQGSGAAAAALSLDFTTSLDSRVTFTRASTGTYFNSAGVMQTASSNVARHDYNPSTLAALGLLIEPAATNICLRSGDQTHADWVQGGGTRARNVTAPDGVSNTATTLTGTASVVQLYQAIVTTNAVHTVSCYFKAGTSTAVRLGVTTGAYEGVTYNLANGTISSSDAGYTGVIQDAGGGWYRCITTRTAALPAATAYLTIDYNTVSSDSFVAWGAQLETGSVATSYIPTVAATVTRAADVASMTGANFSDWFAATEGTFVVTGDSPASGTRPFVSADDNTANERMSIYTSGTDPKFIVVDGGSTVADIDAGSIVARTQSTIAAAYKVNDCAVSVEGGAAVADASVTLPTVDRLRLGGNQAGDSLNGHIASLTYYSTRKSDAELAALTA